MCDIVIAITIIIIIMVWGGTSADEKTLSAAAAQAVSIDTSRVNLCEHAETTSHAARYFDFFHTGHYNNIYIYI